MNAKELISLCRDLSLRAPIPSPDFDDGADIAFECLQQVPQVSNQTVLELMHLCCIDPALIAAQGHEMFGEPSMIVAENNGWIVEILSWRHMITSIHEHSNPGAFRTLDGNRLQLCFSFEDAVEVDDSLRIGKLKCQNVSMLGRGTTTRIFQRERFIHCVWPVDTHASTIVMRRRGPNDSWGYYPGAMHYDVRRAEFHMLQRARYLRDLSKYDTGKHLSTVLDIASNAPLSVLAFLILNPDITGPNSSEAIRAIIELAGNRSDAFGEALLKAHRINQLFDEIGIIRSHAISRKQNEDLALLFFSSFLDSSEMLLLNPSLGLS